jgi:hypothetical protein
MPKDTANKGHGVIAQARLALARSVRPALNLAARRYFASEDAAIRRGIERIAERFPDARGDAPDEPIFILSSGWRCGSTLLQRLVISGNAMIWGEPYAHSAFVQELAGTLATWAAEPPPADWMLSDGTRRDTLVGSWVANLYPEPRHVLEAHRAFFRTMYATPATELGYARWGFKEIRLGIEHAEYLRWLFPRAKFLFLYRDPYASFRSHRGNGAYFRWPFDWVTSPARFAEIWRDLVKGFLDGHERVGGMLVKYEDLCSGKLPVETIATYVGLPLRAEVLSLRVTEKGEGPTSREPLSERDRRAIRRVVDPLAARLGYAG